MGIYQRMRNLAVEWVLRGGWMKRSRMTVPNTYIFLLAKPGALTDLVVLTCVQNR